MAITKTAFTSATGADSLQELFTWLQANADDLFDSITLDSNSGTVTITCTVGGVKAVTLAGNNSNVSTNIWLNGTPAQPNYSTSGIVVGHAYKTSYGIAIRMYAPTAPLNWTATSWLYIFRTSANTVGAIHCRPVSSGTASLQLTAVDFERNSTMYVLAGVNAQSYYVQLASLTVLTPIPLGDGETSANGLFLTPYTELYTSGQWQHTVIDIGGTKYVYDGVIALQE